MFDTCIIKTSKEKKWDMSTGSYVYWGVMFFGFQPIKTNTWKEKEKYCLNQPKVNQ